MVGLLAWHGPWLPRHRHTSSGRVDAADLRDNYPRPDEPKPRVSRADHGGCPSGQSRCAVLTLVEEHADVTVTVRGRQARGTHAPDRPTAQHHSDAQKICGGRSRHSAASVCKVLFVPRETTSSRRGR